MTLLEVVEALDGKGPAFRCSEIRQKGPTCINNPDAYPKPCGIAAVMHRAERAYKAELAAVSIGELARTGQESAPPEQVEKAMEWVGTVIK